MFDFPNDEDQPGLMGDAWRRVRRGETPPIAGISRGGPDFSGMESESSFVGNDENPLQDRMGRIHIPGPGPQRTPAELPAIDAPAVGTKSADSANSETSGRSANLPSIASPSAAATSTRPAMGIAGPTIDPLEQDIQRHRQTRTDMLDKGSGIAQIHNGFLRNLARVGDIAGSVLAPGVMRQIPGTELHHGMLVSGESNIINQDQSEQQKRAKTEHEEAETAALRNPQPKPTEEKWTDLKDYTGPNGEPLQMEEHSGQVRIAGGDILGIKRAAPNSQKEGELALGERVSQLNDMLTSRYQVLNPGQPLPAQYKLPANATQKDYDRIDKGLKGEEKARGTKAQQETANSMRQQALELARQNAHDREEARKKPTPAEQQRADLATNMDENLNALEEIVKRRPDLFGSFGGRMTEWKRKLGTNDPDIGALQTIEHQLGMVQQSTHGMRSAFGVQSAADSIVNGFHNSPEALLGSINAARRSIETFKQDVERAKAGGATIHYVVGKNSYDIPPDKEAAFKKKYPNAVKQ